MKSINVTTLRSLSVSEATCGFAGHVTCAPNLAQRPVFGTAQQPQAPGTLWHACERVCGFITPYDFRPMCALCRPSSSEGLGSRGERGDMGSAATREARRRSS